MQKSPDAVLTCRPLGNPKVLLPHLPHVLLEAEWAFIRQRPGVGGRRRPRNTLNVCQAGGQQLGGAEVEPVDLQTSDKEK